MANTETKTEFNSSMASLMRLHELLINCNGYRVSCFENGYNLESLKKWKYTIDAIYCEVYPKLVKSPMLKGIKKIFTYYTKCGKLLQTEKVNEQNTLTLNPKSFNQLYKINDLAEKQLRLFADRKGMLITEGGDMFGR